MAAPSADLNHDWYKIIECDISSTKEELSTALRKVSRKYHPDKNPDEKAAAMFLLIQRAKEILLDDASRLVYDNALKAVGKRKEYDNKKKTEMNASKKRMREELEERMRKATEPRPTGAPPETKKEKSIREEEIKKLRKQNLERVQAHNEEIRCHEEDSIRELQNKYNHQINKPFIAPVYEPFTIKVKWRKTDRSHSEDSLVSEFKAFGSIESVVLGGSKGTSAIITFTHDSSPQRAVDAHLDAVSFKVSRIEEPKKADIFTHRYHQAKDSSTSNSILMEHARIAVESDELQKGLLSHDESSANNVESISTSVPGSASTLKAKENDVIKRMMEAAARRRQAMADLSTVASEEINNI